MAVTMAILCTNPLDVVKTRLQTLTANTASTSVINNLRILFKQEGIWAMTRGIPARLASSGPLSVLHIVCYEFVKRHSTLNTS